MKVLLISAPTHLRYDQGRETGPGEQKRFIEPPLGILTLAAILRDSPWQCEVVDTNRAVRGHWSGPSCQPDFCGSFAEQLCATPADVYALSSICTTYPFTIRLAAAIRRRLPEAIIVLGGPQASAVDVETMESFPAVDFVVRGEADQVFPRLLGAIAGKEGIAGLPGITRRSRAGVVRHPDAPPILDLDILPLPDYQLCPDVKSWPFVPLELGRGCPFKCTFCSTNDFFRRAYRLKSAPRVLAQMREVKAEYGIQRFDLVHDMFTVNRGKVVQFCLELLRNGKGLEWSCSARTDCVDHELLELMFAAGCRGIFFGIETGSSRMQPILGKGLDLEEARRVVGDADNLGLPTTVSMMVGHPAESIDDFRKTVAFLGDSLRMELADLQLHRLSPLAATPLTRAHRERLVLDRDYSDISNLGSAQFEKDLELISGYRDVFPNFYALPCQMDRDFLEESYAFLENGFKRCRSLLDALHRDSGDLLEVFECWRRWRPIPARIEDYYRGFQFFEDFVRFALDTYAGRGWYATEAACRYCLVLLRLLRPCPADGVHTGLEGAAQASKLLADTTPPASP